MEKTDQRLSKIEIFSICFCCMMAFLSFLSVRNDFFVADERGYLHAAADLLNKGIAGQWSHSDTRTYGYPLYFSQVLRFFSSWDRSNVLIRWPLFASQLFVYIAAAFFLRRKIFALTHHLKFARYFFVSWNINVFALIYLSFGLTDLLSLVFIYLSFFLLLDWFFCRGFLKAFLSGAAIGFSMMIRPANVLLLPLTFLIILGAFVHQSGYRRALVLNICMMILGMGLLCAPQWLNNYVYYQKKTPLVASNLSHKQLGWGQHNLKYGTSRLSEIKAAPIFYKSPWFRGKIHKTSWRTYYEHPFKTSLQFLVKMFALVDMDLCFPYNKSLKPWYRWPGSIISCLVSIFGIFGLFLCKNYFHKIRNLPFSIVYAVIAAGGILFALGYSFTAVECRFGLPVLASLGVLQFPFWDSFNKWTSKKKRVFIAAAFFLLLGGLCLSHWIQTQSIEIQNYDVIG